MGLPLTPECQVPSLAFAEPRPLRWVPREGVLGGFPRLDIKWQCALCSYSPTRNDALIRSPACSLVRHRSLRPIRDLLCCHARPRGPRKETPRRRENRIGLDYRLCFLRRASTSEAVRAPHAGVLPPRMRRRNSGCRAGVGAPRRARAPAAFAPRGGVACLPAAHARAPAHRAPRPALRHSRALAPAQAACSPRSAQRSSRAPHASAPRPQRPMPATSCNEHNCTATFLLQRATHAPGCPQHWTGQWAPHLTATRGHARLLESGNRPYVATIGPGWSMCPGAMQRLRYLNAVLRPSRFPLCNRHQSKKTQRMRHVRAAHRTLARSARSASASGRASPAPPQPSSAPPQPRTVPVSPRQRC